MLKRILRNIKALRAEVREVKTLTQELTADVEGLKAAVTANIAEQSETLALQQTTITKLGELAQTIIDNATDASAVQAAAVELQSLTLSIGESTSALDTSNQNLAAAVGV